MLGRSKRTRESDGDHHTTEPLLSSSRDDLHDDSDVVFSVDDEDEDGYLEASALDPVETPRSKSGRAVRFQEEVQVFTAPLRSTTESREAGK